MNRTLYGICSIALLALGMSSTAGAALITFSVAPGTGASPWNDQGHQFTVHIGDTVRFVNNDSSVHALHTSNNRPCEHMKDMRPNGGTQDCLIVNEFDPATDGPLFDHWHQRTGHFWMKAVP